MPFETTMTVRLSHTDAVGIVYFARVFDICHVAFEELLEAAGYPLSRFFKEADWGMPLVHAEADYRKPLALGDRLTIRLRVTAGRRRSLRVDFEVLGPDREIRAVVQHIHAGVDLKRFIGRDIPEDFVQAMLELAG